MQHTADSVLGLLERLLAIVSDAIGMVLGFARQTLESLGITGPFETLILVLVGVVVLLTAFQLLGRLFLVLLAMFLLLLLLQHVLPPGAGRPAP